MVAARKVKPCPDCVKEGVTAARPIAGLGRCATHLRLRKRVMRAQGHERHVIKTYGLEPGEYAELYEFQGGLCATCPRSLGRSGRTKRLAVDHNHSTGEVRGLICGPCNRFIGLMGDDPGMFVGFALYLADPPARIMRERRAVSWVDSLQARRSDRTAEVF